VVKDLGNVNDAARLNAHPKQDVMMLTEIEVATKPADL